MLKFFKEIVGWAVLPINNIQDFIPVVDGLLANPTAL